MAYSVALIHDDQKLAQLTLDAIPSKFDTFIVDNTPFAVSKMRWQVVTKPRVKVVSVDVLLMPTDKT